MLPTRLGVNCMDIEAWLENPAMKEKLDAIHQANLEESLRVFGNLDLPRNLTAAFEAAEMVTRRDVVALMTELLRHNNEILAAQLEQLGVDTSAVMTPAGVHVVHPSS